VRVIIETLSNIVRSYKKDGFMKRAEIREQIFKLLFCNDFHENEDVKKQIDLFFEGVENIKDNDRNYIENKVVKIKENINAIDEAINKVAVGWTTDRMSKADLAIIRLAYYEMTFDEDIPDRVAIDQAVELAKKYGSDESPSFVNGILAKLI
jgi:N utilization substance protein B